MVRSLTILGDIISLPAIWRAQQCPESSMLIKWYPDCHKLGPYQYYLTLPRGPYYRLTHQGMWMEEPVKGDSDGFLDLDPEVDPHLLRHMTRMLNEPLSMRLEREKEIE